MRINNAIELFHFAKTNGLINIAPELQQLVNCVEEYGRLCACDSQETRQSKINQCRSFYFAFVCKANNYKGALLSKVTDNRLTFYNDQQLLASITH